jgi:UDP-N-acetylglucosamine 2-epimerase (non-hydrolysing)
MKTVLIVAGTRPEAIKLAPLYLELRRSDFYKVLFCSTGQHREMLTPIFEVFGFTPDFELDVMTPNQALHELTSRLLLELHKIYLEVAPDLVVVQGDTTTTFAGALCAYYLKIPVGHLEAGLRSFDKRSPYPEEMNRILATHLSHYHFVPTERARQNLLREAVEPDRVFLVGNTVIDALLHARREIEGREPSSLDPQLGAIDWSKRIVLVTGHRRESFGEPLARICRALRRIADEKDVQVIYPVHLNPNVRTAVFAILGDAPDVHLLEPVSYPGMVYLMDRAYIVVTDSGGIQEEAPSLCRPVLVTREVTERPEGVEAGVARLVGTSEDRIVSEALRLLHVREEYDRMATGRNPYGDGTTSRQIREILDRLL